MPVILRRPCFPVAAPRVYGARLIHSLILPTYVHMLCLGAWSDHGERTDDFYACNRYEAANKKGVYDETERRREMAKHSLERYTHYYECWARNQLMEKLSDIQRGAESQLKFITDTWQKYTDNGQDEGADEHKKKVVTILDDLGEV
ncbi:unnamed protein product [Prunus armeniaca]|uniref:Uncharacterized protein n=1 Tax=Prunus armeniaca TaxID=36596 RepID=A0A6J5THZ1_PRUAR|nr:unnamed protein product [Prunus armeniaca]CAB4294057.1 unnamed protein product [Prunus armeniaca]